MFQIAGAMHRSVLIAAVLVAELVTLAAAYQLAVNFECLAVDAYAMCRVVRSLVARALAVVALALLLIWAMPALFARFVREAASHPRPALPALFHAAGLALILAPLALFDAEDNARYFSTSLPFWLAGAALAAAGGLLWLAPWRAWTSLLREGGRIILPAFALALLVPDIAELALPIWDVSLLTRATFDAVAVILFLLGHTPYGEPAELVVGLETFAVHIARPCSGVEGFALVLVFSAVYATLFGRGLRQGRFWLVVVPLALLASWTFNAIRIALLILIGEYVSPEIAVNGFHSYAGWLFFTVLVLAILWVVQSLAWLRQYAAEAAAPAPLRADPVAARIVPFVAFLVSGIATAAFLAPPDLGFPLRTLAMAAAVLAFLPVLRQEAWRPDASALLAGAAVGLGWALTEPPPGDGSAVLAAALTALPAWMVLAWVLLRLVGTVILVPVVEELFFRAYMLDRLDRGGLVWRVVAVLASSAAFAALHGRVVAALAAGVVFALVYLARRRVGDAVAAHVVANAITAGFAAATGDWSRL